MIYLDFVVPHSDTQADKSIIYYENLMNKYHLLPSKSFILLYILFLLYIFTGSAAAAANPIKIGVTLGLTGKYSTMAAVQKKGFELWARDINQDNGILGRQVQLIIKDDKSDPEVAKTLYREMISKENVDFVFAPFSSEITEAILPLTKKYGYPVIASGASADRIWQQNFNHVFGMFTPASKIAVSFLESLVINNLDKIAIFYGDDPFSRDIAEGSRLWADRFGMEVVLFESIADSSNDYAALALQAQNAGVEVIMSCGQYKEAIAMRLALKDAGWYPKAFYTPVGPGLKEFHDRLNGETEFIFSTSQWEYHGGIISPETKRFLEDFKALYGFEPSYFAATAYAAGQVLTAAINKAASFDREKVNSTLFGLNTKSLIGRFGVNKRGIQIRNYNLVIQIQQGKKEVVWPQQLITAEPVFK